MSTFGMPPIPGAPDRVLAAAQELMRDATPFTPQPSPANIEREVVQAAAVRNSHSFDLHEKKQCKHTVRYGSLDERVPVQDIYLKRSAFVPMPMSIRVTITRL